jgi:hypothetical protein
MEKKIDKLITKLNKEIEKAEKIKNEVNSKFKKSRARQTIQMNKNFIEELQKL